ncbi:hypothetical protein [Hyphomicrobium sp. CS1GBMeth3]|uniref:hypothetical protein n=1 Tax=Hyphomicrobium sp. CS1GBMeth3 TaxID=1892845 RepID=UPI000931CF18|nr:hypothetical protein [Hyphomicrobium sp. CS1GBMeth3]
MRFDFEAFRQLFPELTSITTVFAGGGVALATLIVAYGALVGTGEIAAEAESRGDAVAVEGSVFKPVTATQPQTVETTAARASSADAPVARNLDDPRAVAHAVQTKLKSAGCYSGPVNGIWTASTQAAMREFTARVNARLPVNRADPVLLALIETHHEASCTDAAPSAQSAEAAAGVETQRSGSGQRAERRAELHTSSVSGEAAGRAEHLSYSDEDRRSLDTLAAAEPDTAESDATSAAGTAATAAAAGAAASKAAKPERRSTSRKYRQPSIARQVSRGFRQLQRDLNKLF